MQVDNCLTAESVEGASLAFQSIDDIHGSHGLPLGMLSVCDSISDHVLEEHFQDTTSLLVDESRNTLDTTTASQTTDSRLGNTLDVITQDFAVTLSASLSESLSTFAASRHDYASLSKISSVPSASPPRPYILREPTMAAKMAAKIKMAAKMAAYWRAGPEWRASWRARGARWAVIGQRQASRPIVARLRVIERERR